MMHKMAQIISEVLITTILRNSSFNQNSDKLNYIVSGVGNYEATSREVRIPLLQCNGSLLLSRV